MPDRDLLTARLFFVKILSNGQAIQIFPRKLNTLQQNGYRLAIISWTSKSGSKEYNARVTEVKKAWLAEHLPSVRWDEINIVPYGTPKHFFCHNPLDILFDDEERNRIGWTGIPHDVQNIMEILREI